MHCRGNAQAFVYLVQAGLPPMAAPRAATVGAAGLLHRRRELGRITAGHCAHLIAVTGDSRADLTVMQQVVCVMKEGAVFKQDGRAIDAVTNSGL